MYERRCLYRRRNACVMFDTLQVTHKIHLTNKRLNHEVDLSFDMLEKKRKVSNQVNLPDCKDFHGSILFANALSPLYTEHGSFVIFVIRDTYHNPYPAVMKYLTSIKPDFSSLNGIGRDFAGSNY